MNRRIKIAITVSHPIQHFCPQYVSFAQNENIELKIFFASALGHKKYLDPNFGQEISWDNLQLDKFDHVFLNGDAVIQPDRHIDAGNLIPHLSQYAPDLVIIYGYFQKFQRRVHQWAKMNKIPIAYIGDSERRQHRSWYREILKYLFVKKYFSAISYFLSVGDANEDYYRYYGVPAKKMIKMHYSIDIGQYRLAWEQKDKLRQSIRKRYGIRETDIVLTVVGKLVPWKNQDHIIKAMQLLESENIQLHLFVLGSGETMPLLQQNAALLSRGKVHLCGFVTIDQLPAFYAATDIYVHPASVEPHSIAISEAIYMGCPIVISDRCGSYGPADDVQENKNGWVYKFGNIGELAHKIKLLADNQLLRNEFSLKSHKIAEDFQQQSHYGMMQHLVTMFNNKLQ